MIDDYEFKLALCDAKENYLVNIRRDIAEQALIIASKYNKDKVFKSHIEEFRRKVILSLYNILDLHIDTNDNAKLYHKRNSKIENGGE